MMHKRLKNHTLFFVFIVLSCTSALPQDMHHHHVHEAKRMPGKMHHVMHRSKKKMHAWADPAIKLSPAPPLMGKQMGVVNSLGLKPLGYKREGRVKVFHLTAQPMTKILTDGIDKNKQIVLEKNRVPRGIMHHHPFTQKLRLWGYNGSMPGPTIEVTEGDTIRVIFKNELPEPTSIHWHGIELPNEQDGAAGHTQPPVMPGQTWTYEFTLYQSGTFLYHSGFNMMKQDHYGLVGLLVVHPKKYEDKIDKQFAFMLQEWAILPGSIYPDLVSMDFNWATFNGFAAPNIPHMTVRQGERVRIRIGNMSMNSHPIHMHGYTWQVVGTEGGPIQKSARWNGNTVNVPPGTTRDVEFVAWNPGIWRLHCHKLHHIVNAHADVPMGVMSHGGMFTLLHVLPKDPKKPWRHPRQRTTHVRKRGRNEN